MSTFILEQLKSQASASCTNPAEIIEFIDNQIAARLAGKNPRYEVPTQGECEHIVDYLTKKSDSRKLKLKKASFESVKKKAEDWVERMNKKAVGIVETEEDVEVIKLWKSSGMRLVKLVGEAAYKREGKLMSHCAGSYYGNDNCSIYSLRDAKNEPHCTIEVLKDGDYVQQVKGKGNGDIHPKYVKYVLKGLELIGQEVRESELTYLGYVAASEAVWKFLDATHTGQKYMTYKGKKYFYKGSRDKMKQVKSDKECRDMLRKLIMEG